MTCQEGQKNAILTAYTLLANSFVTPHVFFRSLSDSFKTKEWCHCSRHSNLFSKELRLELLKMKQSASVLGERKCVQ